MEYLAYLIIALALSTTAFSVSLHTSIYRCVEINESMVMGLMFGLFQGGLLLLGYLIGISLENYVRLMAHPLGIIILAFVGLRMVFESRKSTAVYRTYTDKNVKILAAFSLAIGINAFMTGLSLGLIGIRAWYQAGFLIFVTFVMSLIGIRMGKLGKFDSGKRAEISGGLLILTVTLVLFIQYLKIF